MVCPWGLWSCRIAEHHGGCGLFTYLLKFPFSLRFQLKSSVRSSTRAWPFCFVKPVPPGVFYCSFWWLYFVSGMSFILRLSCRLWTSWEHIHASPLPSCSVIESDYIRLKDQRNYPPHNLPSSSPPPFPMVHQVLCRKSGLLCSVLRLFLFVDAD